MSLGRLLLAGRSLVWARDEQNRFRANKHVSMPKFALPKNPFVPTPNKEVEPARTVLPGTPAHCLPHQAADPVTRAALSREAAKSAARVAVWSRAWRWLWERRHKWDLFRRIVHQSPKGRTAAPRFAESPVQGELSLENVRVVRNDLADADLEVVHVKPSAEIKRTAPDLESLVRGASEAGPWSRWTTRIFGAGVK